MQRVELLIERLVPGADAGVAIGDAELPQIEQYATRHTAATLLESLGVPADVRMQIMGQSSKVAHQAYVHVDQSRTRPALDRLAERLLLE